jgi:L-malate glycosyltransferase
VTVLHFIETGIPGGAESMLIDLCRHQLAAGLRPMVAHFDHPYFLERCREIGVDTFPLPDRTFFKSTTTLPLFATAFARRLHRSRVQLLHSHLFGPIVGGALAAFAARIPHIGTLHDTHMIEESPGRIWQLRLALLLGTRLVTVSNQMRDFYSARLRYAANRTSCIHNGTEPATDVCPISRPALSIPTDDVIAILVGRLVPMKRVQDALQALHHIVRQCAVTLIIVGDGPELPALRELTLQLGLGEKVRFLGARRDVPSLLRAADLFLQCSETEGLSMSIIEALHVGLPCVVTRVGGNPELVRHDYNGALYDVGDWMALSSWLRTLATNPAKRQLMGKRSQKLALSDYTASICSQAYLTLYRNVGLAVP